LGFDILLENKVPQQGSYIRFSQASGCKPKVLYLIASCLNCLYSMKFEAGMVSRTATVVDFVAVKTSRLNSFQHSKIFCN
jgi:hypothetical protein